MRKSIISFILVNIIFILTVFISFAYSHKPVSEPTSKEVEVTEYQVVAKSKYGYKWAKWVTRIELSSNTAFRGFWESTGYSQDAEVGGRVFDYYR